MKIAETCFNNCLFRKCNFTMVKFLSSLQNVNFVECKMIGADFSGISRVSNSFRFEKTILNYASFIGVKLRSIVFDECQMEETYFDSADIALSEFKKCNLMRTSFHETNLEKADFSTSYDFCINPNQNRIKKSDFLRKRIKRIACSSRYNCRI
ncbi:MAG: pentapeptide repeat-containing protein [Dysgonomonas sp.]